MLWKKKNKKIALINGGTKYFAEKFTEASQQENIDCFKLNASESIISISDFKIEIYQENEKINLKDFSYAFIRLKGKNPHMTELFSKILRNSSVKTNDDVNLSPTLKTLKENNFNDEKITQMISLSENNLPVPKTIIFSKNSFDKNKETILKNMNFPCVFKSSGAKGKAVWKVQKIDDILELIKNSEYELMMLQELLNMDYDIRTLIFNDKYLGAIKRTSNDGFYTNVSKGGNAERIEISKREMDLCKKACKATGIDFGGVDFVRLENNKISFFEVNKSPQIKGFQKATGINVPKKIIQIIDSK